MAQGGTGVRALKAVSHCHGCLLCLYYALAEVVTSADRASVATLDACEIIDHSLASVCRATVQVTDVAVVCAEVEEDVP